MGVFQNNLLAAAASTIGNGGYALWAWGKNEKGQLGNGNTTRYYSPIQIGTDTDWKYIFPGGVTSEGCSFGIKDDYSLWAWGSGKDGQQGHDNTTDYSSPVQVGSLTNWKSAINGRYFSSFLKTDGTIWCCGEGSRGQMGDGTLATKTSPVQSGSATDWVIHTLAGRSVFAINTSGELWAWGDIAQNDVTFTCNPVQLGTDTDWAVVSGNVPSSASALWATKTTGKLYGWGRGHKGKINHDNTLNIYVGPGLLDPAAAGQQIGSLTDWGTSQIPYGGILGGEHQKGALKTDGTIWGCGENSQGELGDGTATDRSSPVQMGDSSDWVATHGSYRGRFAINSSGELWAWGRNGSRLGDGTGTNRSSPVQIGSDTNWTLARCGGDVSLALKSG